jgi:hypothetical protein
MGAKVNLERKLPKRGREVLAGGLAENAVIEMAAMGPVSVRLDVDARLPGLRQTRRIGDDRRARQQNVEDADGAEQQAAESQRPNHGFELRAAPVPKQSSSASRYAGLTGAYRLYSDNQWNCRSASWKCRLLRASSAYTESLCRNAQSLIVLLSGTS